MQTTRLVTCNCLIECITHTFLRFPVLSFSALSEGASSSPRPPGPMLLLRVLRADFFGDNPDFFGDWEGALKEPFAIKPSAMLSLLPMAGLLCSVVCGGGVRDESTDVNTEGANPNNGAAAKPAHAPSGLLTALPPCAPPHHTDPHLTSDSC
jgi:hypothetical protein